MNYKAKKTEYKGVVYRSKTEAIFARCLDLGGFLYEYEPYYLGHPYFKDEIQYQPDFLVTHPCLFPMQRHILVEIKPKIPTQTYFDHLNNLWYDKKPYTLRDTTQYIYSVRRVDFLLIVFNPFENNGSFDIYSPFNGNSRKWVSFSDNLEFYGGLNSSMFEQTPCMESSFLLAGGIISNFKKAFEYRFDLEQC